MLIKQLKDTLSRTGLTNTLTSSNLYFFVSLGIVVGYCLLPVLLNDYTWIPGEDYIEHLLYLDGFPRLARYYGIFLAKLLPFDNATDLRIFYYSTPLLVFLGLFSFLRYNGILAVLFTFTVLFFISSVILQDMEAGSFIAIISFYSIVLPSLFFICKYNLSKWLTSALLIIAVLFHTAIGVFLLLGYTIARVRKPIDLLPLIIPCILGSIMVLHFGGSLTQSAQLINGPDSTYAPPVTFIYFTKKFLGVTTLAALGLMFLFCYNTSKFTVFKDRFILTLLLISGVLAIFAFSPYFPIISYRLSLFSVGSVIVAFCFAFAKAYVRVVDLNPKATKYINLGIIITFLVLLYNTVPELLTYWLSMGV